MLYYSLWEKKNPTALIPSLWLEDAQSACRLVIVPSHGCLATRILAADGKLEEQKEVLKDTIYVPLKIF